jgi:hypothetical protein
MLTLEKKTLTLADIDAQSAFELPSRETLALVNVIVNNVLNGLTINIPVQNNHVGVQVCAAITALNDILVNTATGAPTATLTCTLSV